MLLEYGIIIKVKGEIMKAKKINKSLIITLGSIVILTIYIISDNNFAIYDTNMSGFIFNLATLLMFMGIAFFIQIIIHELGHLLFGLIASYKFSSFRVLNFLFLKRDNRIKLERLNIPGTAGQCLMKPKSVDMSLSSALIFNLGGGVFNIIISIILLIFHNKFFSETTFSMFSRAVLGIGFYAAFSNLIPIKMGPIPNDGYNALMLSKDRKSVKVFNETLLIQDYITRSYMFNEIPDKLLYFNPDLDYSNPIYTGSLAFYHESLLDKEKYKKAYELNNLVSDQWPRMIDHYKNYFKTNRLFFDIIKSKDKDNLEERFKEFNILARTSPNSPSILRIQYAYHRLVSFNSMLGKQAEKDFKRYIKVYPFKSDIKIETQLFNLVEDKVKFLNELEVKDS